MSTKVAALMTQILDELIDRNGLSLPEAVARINAQWGAFDLTSATDIVLHETDFYWATVILYEEPIPDWCSLTATVRVRRAAQSTDLAKVRYEHAIWHVKRSHFKPDGVAEADLRKIGRLHRGG